MPYRFIITLAALLLAGPAIAWDVACEVDDFTDEEICQIRNVHRDDDGRWIFMFGLDDEGDRLVFITGPIDAPGYITDSEYLIRVDEQDAIDITQSASLRTTTDASFATLDQGPRRVLVDQMKGGYEMRVRLSTNRGRVSTTGVSLMGFTDAWQEFSDRSGVAWE